MINCMARRPHAEASPKARRLAPIVASAAASRRSSQRQRLLSAVTELAIRDGYAAVTVGEVIAHAGVSRATFYEYFTDMEACFAAALAPIRRRLLAGIRSSVASDRAEHASLRAAHALLAFAGSRPAMARLLMSDLLTGGERLWGVRDELIDDAARIVEDAHGRAGASARIPDLPPQLLIGVSCRLIAARLHEGGADVPRLGGLHEELAGWVAAYRLPVARHRWHPVTELPPAARSPYLPPNALHAPPALMPGRQRSKDGALAENQWLRLVFATAEVIRRDGYQAATVAQITEVAGVDPRAFYRVFASKQQALAAACGLLFRHAMAAAAGAFVAGETWPERLWEAARALTQYADWNRTLTHVSVVESQAGGASMIRRREELTRAFAIFLQEGFAQLPSRTGETFSPPSEVALEAIGMAVFELAYRHTREDCEAPLSTLLAPIVFISLAPFLGAEQASDLLDRQMADAYEQRLLASAA
jgi:AcrR family transcriptional regulator